MQSADYSSSFVGGTISFLLSQFLGHLFLNRRGVFLYETYYGSQTPLIFSGTVFDETCLIKRTVPST